MTDGARTSTALNCFTCQTRGRTEWCVLTDEEMKLIDQAKLAKNYLPGEVIFREGDKCRGIHCVESGLIGIRKMNVSGQEILLRLGHPGDTMGYRSFLAGDSHNNSAEALEPSAVCFIDSATVRSLLQKNPSLGFRFLKHAATDLGAAENKVLESATLPVRARFAHLLLVLKDRYGVVEKDGKLNLDLPLSRQDLAAMIGVRPESMSRTIRSFEDDEIARFTGRRVEVGNIQDLIDELDLPETL